MTDLSETNWLMAHRLGIKKNIYVTINLFLCTTIYNILFLIKIKSGNSIHINSSEIEGKEIPTLKTTVQLHIKKKKKIKVINIRRYVNFSAIQERGEKNFF